MTLRDALCKGRYFHPIWGMVSNQPHDSDAPNCENYFLFTARYWDSLTATGGGPTREEFSRVRAYIIACKIVDGEYCRFPGMDREMSQDEAVGIARYSTEAAKAILNYGMEHDWSWTESGEWTWTQWLGRHGYFVPFLRVAAGYEIGMFSQILWATWTVASTFSPKQDTSGKLLQEDQFGVMKDKYAICDAAITYWKWAMDRMYPGGRAERMAIYFPNHPLGEYLKYKTTQV